MQHYNLRLSSVTDSQLNSELSKYGAKTFGSKERKYERLRRFQELDQRRNDLVDREQERVLQRSRMRAHEVQEGRARYNTRRVVREETSAQRKSLLRVILSYLG